MCVYHSCMSILIKPPDHDSYTKLPLRLVLNPFEHVLYTHQSVSQQALLRSFRCVLCRPPSHGWTKTSVSCYWRSQLWRLKSKKLRCSISRTRRHSLNPRSRLCCCFTPNPPRLSCSSLVSNSRSSSTEPSLWSIRHTAERKLKNVVYIALMGC